MRFTEKTMAKINERLGEKKRANPIEGNHIGLGVKLEEESFVILGKLTGTTYAEKKEEVRQKAIDFQRIDEGGLSWGEVAEIESYFRTYGKRYGLLREFKENGIC